MNSLPEFHFLKLNESILTDPYPYFALLREQAPVHREPDFGVHIVSRYDDVVDVNRRPEDFSNVDIGAAPFRALPAPLDEMPAWRDAQRYADRLITNDPPEHTRYRKVINRLFTPRRVAALEPRIRELANELIDEFIDCGEVEFVSQYANLLPRMVVSELLGVPRDDAATLKDHFRLRSNALRDYAGDPKADWAIMLKAIRTHRPADDLERVMGISGGQFVLDYFTDALARRAAGEIDGDILSELVRSEFPDGSPVPVDSILPMVLLLYVAGGDANTTELLSNSLLVLLRYPDVERELRDEPQLVEPFVEEVLRYDSPLLGIFRVARRATSVGGVPIAKGEIVMALHASANHDASHFADGDTFDLHRNDRQPIMSFGFGTHFCPGAALARTEGRITTSELLRRTSKLRLANEGGRIAYMPSVIQRTPVRVDITFDKQA